MYLLKFLDIDGKEIILYYSNKCNLEKKKKELDKFGILYVVTIKERKVDRNI